MNTLMGVAIYTNLVFENGSARFLGSVSPARLESQAQKGITLSVDKQFIHKLKISDSEQSLITQGVAKNKRLTKLVKII